MPDGLKTLFLHPPVVRRLRRGRGLPLPGRARDPLVLVSDVARPAGRARAGLPARRRAARRPHARRRRCRSRAHYELAVLHTSTPSFASRREGGGGAARRRIPRLRDRLRRRARGGRAARPRCAPRRPSTSWRGNEFDFTIQEVAQGRPLDARRRARATATNGRIARTPRAPAARGHGRLPFVRRLQARPRRRALLHRLPAASLRVALHRAAAAARSARSACGRRRWAGTATARAASSTWRRRWRSRRAALSRRSGSSSSTTTPSPTTCRGPRRSRGGSGRLGITWSCNAKAERALRDAQGPQGQRPAPAAGGLRVGQPADPEQRQEGRAARRGARGSRGTRRRSASRSTGRSSWGCPARRARPSQETIRFAREIDPDTHPGLARRAVPGHRALPGGAASNGWLEDERRWSTAAGVQTSALGYPHLSRTEIFALARSVLPPLLLPPPQDLRHRRRDGCATAGHAAAARRGRRVPALPARRRRARRVLSVAAGVAARPRVANA